MIKEKQKKIVIGIEKNPDTLEGQASTKNVFLALGSNLNSKFGSRIQNLEIAQFMLLSNGIDIVDRSSYYESLSYRNKSKPKFINIVIKVKTIIKPNILIKIILDIEKKIGRIRNIKNSPRVCDVDIIDYKNLVINKDKSSDLIIPHKLAHERSFVLLPLAEICPKWKHPKLGIKINQLINNLKVSDLNFIKKI